ncbi:hypothetical protein C0J52_01966 [Blattella germanica]|nr:hypothetical protein C0J52_01966 [Blattella germanica]
MALHGPNNKDLAIILAEVGEKPRTLEQNLVILKNWLSFQPHLPQIVDDNLLAVFLRGCKHNVERTKNKLDKYYTGRAAVPELFSNRDPFSKEIRDGSRAMNIYPLPQLSPGGYRVTMHRFHSFDPNQLDVQCIFKYLFMLADIRILEETPISGDIYLFDLQDIVLSHCAKLASPLLRKTLILAQEAFPQRLKEIHVFNAPPFVDWILNFFKPLMKEKMRNRFHIHNGHESLYKHVPQHILPTDYGGEDDWMKKLQSYHEWFKKQENVKADEKRRPYKDHNYNTSYQLFGYEGAFRTLNID